MNEFPQFTVILSGYQTAPYLPKALKSIACQTLHDFDVICYVEESTDESLAICQEFARNDSRFKVVSAPKSGAVATTRNYGIDHAAGEYMVTLDGDDWIAPDMLEKLSKKIASTGALDVLSFSAVTTETEDVDWDGAPRITNFRPSDAAGVFSGLEAIRRTGRNGSRMNNHTVLSIYRTAFLRERKLYQKDGMLMEDFEWTPRVWFHAERFAYIDEPFYVYRRRPGSLTTEASSRIIIDVAHEFRSLLKFADEHSVPDDILPIWGNQWISILYWFLFHPVTSRKISNADRSRALKIIMDDNGRTQIWRLAARSSRPKRIALPLVLLAAKGWQWPAKVFFRKLYYPLIGWKTSKNAFRKKSQH